MRRKKLPILPPKIQLPPPVCPGSSRKNCKPQSVRGNALKKLEEEIEQLETRDNELDELMALPENAVNVAKCVEISKEKDAISAKLETLYEQWEELSEEE